MLAEKCRRCADYAPVILRVVLGVILFWHGQAKLLNFAAVADQFGSLGLPLPALVTVIAILVEFVGGTLLVLGLLTRLAALGVVLEFIVIVLLKLTVMRLPLIDPAGSGGAQLDLLILAVALALLLLGSHTLSLEQMLFKKELI